VSQGLLIKELPDGERPRERLMDKGADALKHSELIAILLRTGTKGVSAVQVAEHNGLARSTRFQGRASMSCGRSRGLGAIKPSR